jgi:glycosyltransferase involved in cell wall biosynthesis
MQNDFIDVIIPVYNGGKLLLSTLRCLENQTYKNARFVIVDNGSIDGSSGVIDDFLGSCGSKRWSLVRYPSPTGMTSDWNRAMNHCRAPFVKLLPCDDLLEASCLENEIRLLNNYPEVGFSVAKKWLVNSHGGILKYPFSIPKGLLESKTWKKKLLSNPINILGEPGAVTIRRELLLETGLFDTSFSYYPDLDMWIRLLERAPAFSWGGKEYFFRVHSSSATSGSAKRAATEFARLNEKHLNPSWNKFLVCKYSWVKSRFVGELRQLYMILFK